MDSVARVKKTLTAPIRKLSRFVSGLKKRRLCAKRSNKGVRGGGGRGGCRRVGRTHPPQSAHPKDPLVIRSYMADREKERKLREAVNAQKNEQRAALRAHFRRKYRLSESTKDMNHLRSVGGKASLPCELSKIIHPETKAKDNGFNLLSAFQGLSFGTVALTEGKHSRMSTNTRAGGDSCKVM